jgi:hypothetical protein
MDASPYAPDALRAAYLRIFGLSFSGKYISQKGQWKFIPDPSMWGLTTKILLHFGHVTSTA